MTVARLRQMTKVLKRPLPLVLAPALLPLPLAPPLPPKPTSNLDTHMRTHACTHTGRPACWVMLYVTWHRQAFLIATAARYAETDALPKPHDNVHMPTCIRAILCHPSGGFSFLALGLSLIWLSIHPSTTSTKPSSLPRPPRPPRPLDPLTCNCLIVI